jgi:uncharacterized repeat protein (TIGR03803 family)
VQPPIGAPGAMAHAIAHASSSSYQVLHRFLRHGSVPQALVNVDGILYGTTAYTRGPGQGHHGRGNGTVFTISTTGVKKLLYNFKGGVSDGANPSPGGLIDVNGTLYGTTYSGGGTGCHGLGCGTVYSISTSGSEKVLYSFKGGSEDGALPYGLVEMNGTLYGTTVLGGTAPPSGCSITGNSPGCGTVFSLSTSGSEKILHAFQGVPDGANPQSALIHVNGTLYGITYDGGTCGKGSSKSSGCNSFGTVYSITASGSERVLHRFKYDSGPFPTGGLVDVGGMLYGTTGGTSTFSPCCGTVYRLGTNGAYKRLYSFTGGSDGGFPFGGLMSANGVLYGTTLNGGVVGCTTGSKSGCGTIFSVTTSGKETVLYSFLGVPNGAHPIATLTDVKHRLFGTTAVGGNPACEIGCGTVFALSI